MKRLGRRAVVIGASMAGLVCARVLADRFEEVVVLDRDRLTDTPDPRDGVPQGRHVHNLLSRGDRVLDRLFPDLYGALRDGGAIRIDWSRDVRWHHHGVWKARCESGVESWLMSRPFLEDCVRKQLLRVPNVRIESPVAVADFVVGEDDARVTGLRLEDGKEVAADLVLDCSGRNGVDSETLARAGFPKPRSLSIGVDVVYCTREMRPRKTPDFSAIAQIAPPPGKRSGVAFAIENDRWVVTLFGYHGDHPPRDEAGWTAFAESLDQPDIYRLIMDSDPLTPPRRFHYRASEWRRYDRAARRPARLLNLGDSVCSFNPIYGQGMTSATLQAEALDKWLAESGDLNRIHEEMPKRLARVINECWQAVASEDFRHAETRGDRIPLAAAINWYTRRVHRLASKHDDIETAFLKVMHMERGFGSLFHPSIMTRALMRPL